MEEVIFSDRSAPPSRFRVRLWARPFVWNRSYNHELFLDERGIGSRSCLQEILIPWHRLDRFQPMTRVDPSHYRLNLKSLRAGRDVIMTTFRKARFVMLDGVLDSLISLEGDAVLLKDFEGLPKHFGALVAHYRDLSSKRLEENLVSRRGGKVRVVGNNRCYYDKGGWEYPSFCPFTGDETTTVALLKADGVSTLWPISEGVSFRIRALARAGAFLMGTAFFIWRGWELRQLQFTDWAAAFLWNASIFALPLVVWYASRLPVEAFVVAPSEATVLSFRKTDYFDALVDLNAAEPK